MTGSNKEVVLGFIEEVINQKRLDRFDEYISPDSIYHTGPFVGLGISTDETSGEKIAILMVVPGGPADGKLQAGDEIVHIHDEQHTWDTYQELKTGLWGRGMVGTPLTMRVLRDGKVLDFALKRGLISGAEVPILKIFFHQLLLVDWPDLKETVDCILEEGDLVVVELTNTGTNAQYKRQVVWKEIEFYRVQDGKIVEGWGLEDEYSQLKQLGYRIEPPAN